MPTLHYCEQGSDEWLALRLGIPTASEFPRIVTPTGRYSKQSRAYAIKLVTEKLMGEQLDTFEETEWMKIGHDREFEAVKAYELATDLVTKKIGFILSDCCRYGASPDRLVNDAGLLEVKCPKPNTQLGYILDGFAVDYRPQVQGQLLVSGREWDDWISYLPKPYSLLRVRVPRDEEYIEKLRAALDEFCDEKDKIEETARRAGFYVERTRVVTPFGVVYLDRMTPGEMA